MIEVLENPSDTRIQGQLRNKDKCWGEGHKDRCEKTIQLYKERESMSQKRCQVLLKCGKDRRNHLFGGSGKTRLGIYRNASEW